jgi:hypothetical protein
MPPQEGKKEVVMRTSSSSSWSATRCRAAVEAKNDYSASRAADKECLATKPPGQCEGLLLAMEADQHAYNDLSGGIQEGGNQTLTVNTQSR